MDEYLDDLKSGRIQFRDKWQFELKNELFPLSHLKSNLQTQEFYFFIPNSLQINEQTYSQAQFYLDQTNLIRLKTPVFTFKELVNKENAESPLVRILMISNVIQSRENGELIQDEVKLLGNIFHSALRNKIAEFFDEFDYLGGNQSRATFGAECAQFLDDLETFRSEYVAVKTKCLAAWSSNFLGSEFDYIDEFISININDYLTAFLSKLRTKSHPELASLDKRICEIILKEKYHREEKFYESAIPTDNSQQDEHFLYRKGVLNKFVIDPLLLKTTRTSVSQRYRGVILGIPAAVAMLIYLLLFLWQGNVFLINSEPFIILTVFIYVLKDRLKEDLRNLSYREAAKLFSDYTTEILPPGEGGVLGYMKESFSFVEEKKVPEDIIEVRNREFHGVLEGFKRPEQVIYYKKTVNIKQKPKKIEARFYGFSIIFRFDIHHFLAKAEDPYQTYINLDPETLELHQIQLPRVYHLNIILKNTVMLPDGTAKVELKKFRLIIDKNGIKRIEYV